MVNGRHESETCSSVSPPSLHRLGDEPQVPLSTAQLIDFIVYHLANHLSSIVSVVPDVNFTA